MRPEGPGAGTVGARGPGAPRLDHAVELLRGAGLDVDCGHVAPHLALVNGARASVSRVDGRWTLEQVLV